MGHDSVLASLETITGIIETFELETPDRFQLFDIELAAEKRAFMGMGLCYNSGIREVLRAKFVAVAITSKELDWGCQSHMLLKKDDEIVGEEVRDPVRIQELQEQKNTFFLHRNFVIYKDKVNFPDDLISKKCIFELPVHTPEKAFASLEAFGNYIFCFPSTPGDIFLKEKYFDGKDDWGTGTALFGFIDYE
jgi:hypothetical protein